MRNRGNEHHTTIIKRSARKNHGEVHGGAWKVAFADFTLAMMALFMVLWIMGSVTEEERKEIVSMLHGESIFDGNTLTPISQKNGQGGQLALIGGGRPTLSSTSQRSAAGSKSSGDVSTSAEESEGSEGAGDARLGLTTDAESLDEVNARSHSEIDDLARIIMKITSTYDAQANLKMEIVPQGLRILVSDDQKREMFQRSSAILTPFFRRLLTEFAPELNKIDNKIIITGHTDATHYRDQERYNNWNLSGERAMQARAVLTQRGAGPGKNSAGERHGGSDAARSAAAAQLGEPAH
jgi:chemotaxis protein MotB